MARILIAEDNILIGMLLADSLEVMGHEVCANVSSEAETVSAALRTRPDLMIVDAGLGAGCGVTAVETISRFMSVPYFFVSGDKLRDRRLPCGVVVVLKPYSEGDLAKAIAQVLMQSLEIPLPRAEHLQDCHVQ